jgi:hypothetical protein
MTTFGRRIKNVHIVIESIARGRMLPSRLLLWIDETEVLRAPSAGLRRLQARGLEILPCDNYGPHKKYFPYVMGTHEFDKSLVVADDDIIYPRYWLEELVKASHADPGAVRCYRARVIGLNGDSLERYDNWKMCFTTTPHYRHIATGVSGVLYPPRVLKQVKESGDGFRACCPRADDLWLHLQTLRSCVKISQVYARPIHFLMLPGSQTSGLFEENMLDGGNDRQVARTYSQEDILRIRDDV